MLGGLSDLVFAATDLHPSVSIHYTPGWRRRNVKYRHKYDPISQFRQLALASSSTMDPLSITAGVAGILDVVSRLSIAVSKFKEDYKLADEDLNTARGHALLLKEEIRALEARKWASYSPPHKMAKKESGDALGAVTMDESSFEKGTVDCTGSLIQH
ncbi:hypothetical protein MFIFM68171_08364 [Madurella fahalii]|uniref:Uncharacterized protein n=1 Tax=Madurella fahalii TaxID=1157608 RepID=A0ABQ0GK83_9PEZI